MVEFSPMACSDSPAMDEQMSSSQSSTSSAPATPPPPSPSSTLMQHSTKKKNKPRVLRVFRSVFRSFPIITPACKLPSLHSGGLPDSHHRISSSSTDGSRITGTLFGYRKGRVTLSLQENPRTLPTLVVELAMQTHALQRDMSIGMVRIALECEKRETNDKTKVFEEPLWTVFSNGKKIGYGAKREATEEDLHVMESLKVVSMGAGVLPGKSDSGGDVPDEEIAYMRAYFEQVVGSKDSVTLYMLSPDVNNGPELSIFIVRI